MEDGQVLNGQNAQLLVVEEHKLSLELALTLHQLTADRIAWVKHSVTKLGSATHKIVNLR